MIPQRGTYIYLSLYDMEKIVVHIENCRDSPFSMAISGT
jgi:hypothetical protein